LAFGFGKDRRLTRRADFVRVQKAGERTTSRHFVFLVAAGDPPNRPTRIGFVTTKKLGPAPMRNRIRRVCRECFRTWPELMPDGFDVVVIARAGAETLGLRDVRAEWARARPALLARCSAIASKIGES
jgi:ribonuclease P protein component